MRKVDQKNHKKKAHLALNRKKAAKRRIALANELKHLSKLPAETAPMTGEQMQEWLNKDEA
jgi:hypothetical protein